MDELFNDDFLNDMLLNPDLYGLEKRPSAAEDEEEDEDEY